MVNAVKIRRYISTIYKDSSQKRAGLYNRNRKRSPLFIYTTAKYYGQRNKKNDIRTKFDIYIK